MNSIRPRELRRKQEQLAKKEENKRKKREDANQMRQHIQKIQLIGNKGISLQHLRNKSLANYTIDSVRSHLPDDIHTAILPFVRYEKEEHNYSIDIKPRTARLFKMYKLHDLSYLKELMETIPVDKLEKYVRRGSAKIYYKKCYNTSIYLEKKEELKKYKWYKLNCYSFALSKFMKNLRDSITEGGIDWFENISNEEKSKMLENLLLSFIFVHRKYSTEPLVEYF